MGRVNVPNVIRCKCCAQEINASAGLHLRHLEEQNSHFYHMIRDLQRQIARLEDQLFTNKED